MYNVSQAYLEKINDPHVIQRRIRGSVGNVEFTENDILSGSFTYTEQAVSGNDIKLGGVFVGQMSMTFLKSFSVRVQRGTWKGLEINVRIGLKIGNDWEEVPLKPYVIDDADHSASGVSVKAYDYMNKFDKNITIGGSSGTLYTFLTKACETCDVEFGMTEQEVNALPNGNQMLGLYPTNDIETWRDVISWCAVTMAGFATIDRDGKLVIRQFRSYSQPDIVIGVNSRYSGGSWSDFETYYTGISVVNIEEETTSYYGTSVGDVGLTMNLGSDPFLQYGTVETKTEQRRRVLEALQDFRYVPFKSTSYIDPAIDLGDIIGYQGGLADDVSVGCVMKIDFNYAKGCTLQGFGKNPALFNAKSKTDKNISGLSSRTISTEYATVTYVNFTEYALGDQEPQRVIDLRFASSKSKVVALFHEINLDVEAVDPTEPIECHVYYYLNSELITLYQPVATWDNDGKHILSLMYFIQTLEGGATNQWNVALELVNATGVIEIGSARAMVQGQGLIEEHEWDGKIEFVGDNAVQVPAYIINAITASGISERLSSRLYEVEEAMAREGVSLDYINGIACMEIHDTIFIELQNPDYVKRAGEGYYAVDGGGMTTGLL